MKNEIYICGESITKEDMDMLPAGFRNEFLGVNFPSRKDFCDAGFLACHVKAEFENGILLKDERCFRAAEYLRQELDKVLGKYRIEETEEEEEYYYDDHYDEIEDMYVHF